jgi:hypothetical protein
MVRRRGLVGTVYLGPADVAAPDGDQALGLEDPDRLADRRIADPELLDQLVLGGEPVVAGEDAGPQLSRDGLRDPVLRDTGAWPSVTGRASMVRSGHRARKPGGHRPSRR